MSRSGATGPLRGRHTPATPADGVLTLRPPAADRRTRGARGAAVTADVLPMDAYRRRHAECRTPRPLVIELVGPWGTGKGTLLAALGAADPTLLTTLDVWHLPRPLLAQSCVAEAATLAGLFRTSRRTLWAEAKQVVKLRAIHRQLHQPRYRAHRGLVLDEGPIFALSTLLRTGHPVVGTGGLASWWSRAYREWAEAVDIVVLLDAPNLLLAERINERRRHHPLQGRPTTEVFQELDAYRTACMRVLDGLGQYGAPLVVEFRTDQQSSSQIAEQVIAALGPPAHAR